MLVKETFTQAWLHTQDTRTNVSVCALTHTQDMCTLANQYTHTILHKNLFFASGVSVPPSATCALHL